MDYEFIHEDQVVLAQTFYKIRQNLDLTVYSNNDGEEIENEIQQSQKSLLQILQCGICFTVLTKNKNPLQCSECKNILFCKACVLKMDQKCSFCNRPNVSFVPISSFLQRIIDALTFKCTNSSSGCNELFTGSDSGILKHQNLDCKFKNNVFQAKQQFCTICNQKMVPDYIDKQSAHICNSNQNQLFCEKHRAPDSYNYTKDRLILQNPGSKSNFYQFIQIFSCYICQNLVREPRICSNCDSVFCSYCITEHLNRKSDLCPKCYILNPKIIDSKKSNNNFVQTFKLISQFAIQIKCKNYTEGCQFQTKFIGKLSYEQNLETHEEKCYKCPDCRRICNFCQVLQTNTQYDEHLSECKAKSQQAQLDQSLSFDDSLTNAFRNNDDQRLLDNVPSRRGSQTGTQIQMSCCNNQAQILYQLQKGTNHKNMGYFRTGPKNFKFNMFLAVLNLLSNIIFYVILGLKYYSNINGWYYREYWVSLTTMLWCYYFSNWMSAGMLCWAILNKQKPGFRPCLYLKLIIWVLPAELFNYFYVSFIILGGWGLFDPKQANHNHAMHTDQSKNDSLISIGHLQGQYRLNSVSQLIFFIPIFVLQCIFMDQYKIDDSDAGGLLSNEAQKQLDIWIIIFLFYNAAQNLYKIVTWR